jgi:hypothetical protein
MDNAIPVEVEEEQTVPERPLTNVELVFGAASERRWARAMDRLHGHAPLLSAGGNPQWDCDNGVDDRGSR